MLSAPRDDELYQKGGVVYFKVHFEYTSRSSLCLLKRRLSVRNKICVCRTGG
nr:MAG TPA: hypothetical protein [Caudoviricetes sp.]DAK71894.1 MAG TPA: hypothetical protein [Caudoviricetes sp.]